MLGKNAVEVKSSSQHITLGVHTVNTAHQAVRFTLVTWLRWCLPGFSTAKLPFPPLSKLFSLELSH